MPRTAVQYLPAHVVPLDPDPKELEESVYSRLEWHEVSRGFVLEPGWEAFSRHAHGLES